MSENKLTFVKDALLKAKASQDNATVDWHADEPLDTKDVCSPNLERGENGEESLIALALAQHLMNFKLWHTEDQARRKDVGDDIIARCKRTIDGFNQRRNDFMEKVDACVVNMCLPHMSGAPARYNTESIGAAVDRMSILSLKAYHMNEETDRTDVDQDHINACRQNVATIYEQREDLFTSILELIDDYASGAKRPRVYYQFKMYNDPNLNPALYAKK